MSALSPQDALIAVMVATSAADETLSAMELISIEQIVDALPVFDDYDADRIKTVSQTVFDLLEEEDGLDALIGLVSSALPDGFNETAYALACDVAASDGKVRMSELRWLEIVRQDLSVGRLAAAAIERGARARFMRLPG